MNQDNASEKAAKKARYQSSDPDKDVINAASDAEEWTSTCPSSEDETLGEAISNEGCSQESFNNLLDDEAYFLSAMNDDEDCCKSYE